MEILLLIVTSKATGINKSKISRRNLCDTQAILFCIGEATNHNTPSQKNAGNNTQNSVRIKYSPTYSLTRNAHEKTKIDAPQLNKIANVANNGVIFVQRIHFAATTLSKGSKNKQITKPIKFGLSPVIYPLVATVTITNINNEIGRIIIV